MNKIGASVFDFSVSLPNTSCLKIVIKTYTWNNNSVYICVCVCIYSSKAHKVLHASLWKGLKLPVFTQMHLLFLTAALCCRECALGFIVKN